MRNEWNDVLAYAEDPAACLPSCWVEGLLALLAKLPPVRREVTCAGCWSPSGSYRLPGVDCSLCNGTGLRVVEVPAARWWPVQVGLWVAEECEADQIARANESDAQPEWDTVEAVRVALNAVQRWLDEPTQERAGEWGRALGSVGRWEFLWLPRAWTGDHRTQLLAASELIDVRAVVLAGLQGVT